MHRHDGGAPDHMDSSLEVRAHAGIVLTVLYRVAGSMRSRRGSRQPACGAVKARKPVHYAKSPALLL